MAYVIRSANNKKYLMRSEEDQIISFNFVQDTKSATRFETESEADAVKKECVTNALCQAEMVERYDSHGVDVDSIMDFTGLKIVKD